MLGCGFDYIIIYSVLLAYMTIQAIMNPGTVYALYRIFESNKIFMDKNSPWSTPGILGLII